MTYSIVIDGDFRTEDVLKIYHNGNLISSYNVHPTFEEIQMELKSAYNHGRVDELQRMAFALQTDMADTMWKGVYTKLDKSGEEDESN